MPANLSPQSPINHALAAEIRAERAAAGLTQQQLATASGINYETLRLVLTGERPINITQIVALATVFSITPADLVHRATRRLERTGE